MTIDLEILPAMLMAYADGELDDIAARRVERAIIADPTLAATVAAHRELKTRLADGFAPVARQPVADRFAALLAPSTVVALARRAPARWWPTAAAIAASLVIGVLTGQAIRPVQPIASGASGLVASGDLAAALDTQLAATQAVAPIRMIASFRDGTGSVCRTFAAPALSGIACRSAAAWQLRQTASGAPAQTTDYRQAASASPAILAAAQDMMAGAPLDATQERAARDRGWR